MKLLRQSRALVRSNLLRRAVEPSSFIARRFNSSSGPIEETRCPEELTEESFAETIRPFYEKETPVILRSCLKNWQALDQWKDWDYLVQKVGADRHVDVEVGAYNQGDKLHIPFGQYVEYLNLSQELFKDSESPPLEQILYLAQNELPSSLQEDIKIPALCSDAKYRIGQGHLYHQMLWMGPKGCVSPLHYDPLDNLLFQVVGGKRIILVCKDTDPSKLYVGEAYGQQDNTSAVDVEQPDYATFPQFQPVITLSGELHTGDALFLPAKWWHHVRSLDFSISVNAWWR